MNTAICTYILSFALNGSIIKQPHKLEGVVLKRAGERVLVDFSAKLEADRLNKTLLWVEENDCLYVNGAKEDNRKIKKGSENVKN